MATYYIKPDGDDGAAGTSVDAAWETIGKANSTLVAGDTVEILFGTYFETIDPANSGSSGNLITYKNYTGDDPVISRYVTLTGWTQYSGEIYETTAPGSGYGLFEDDYDAAGYMVAMNDGPGIASPDDLQRGEFYLNEKLYARCSDGADPDTHIMRWTNNYGARLEDVDYIVIDGITMRYNMRGVNIDNCDHCLVQNCSIDYTYAFGVLVGGASAYNVIKDNILKYNGSWYRDEGDGIHLSNASYNLVEGNDIQLSAHASITSYGAGSTPHHNIIQDNDCYDGGSSGLNANMYPYNEVWRRNISHNHTGCGIQTDSSNNLWYLNTCYHNGWVEDANSPNMSMYSEALNNIVVHNTFYDSMNCIVEVVEYGEETVDGNIFKNNIFYTDDNAVEMYIETLRENVFTHNCVYDANHQNIQTAADGVQTVAWFEENHSDNFSDNVIDNPDMTDPGNGDFTLQDVSPCINAGIWLTTITSENGEGTEFVVDDARYFINGYGITDGDTIYFEGGGSRTVTGVNYDTDTITVNSSISWTQGDGVTLIDFATAPDIGANQYEEEAPPETTQHDDVIGFGANF
jgi:hypothetical protein